MRFWQENGSADPADPNRWRARINHVNSRQKLHVVGLERAFGLVRAMLVDENGLSLEKYLSGRIHNIRVSPEAASSAQLGSSIWRFWRCLFSLSPTAASFDTRRFHVGDAAARERLQRIGEVFIAGFNRALRADAPVEICEYLDALDPDLRGFAAEGAAMGCAIGDAVMLGGHRLRAWVHAADEFSYLTHIGAGWALARVPWRRRAILHCLDPVHRWLAFDGLGFHDGYFYSRRIASGWRRLQAGYAARTYDQGVGRAIWFIAGGSAERAIELIANLDPARRSDLWAGLGLALAYAGGANPLALKSTARAAGSALPFLAQGAAFAAEARARARHVPANTREAVRILTGLDAEDAVQLVRRVRASLPPVESAGAPRYELWRTRVQQALGSAGGARHG